MVEPVACPVFSRSCSGVDAQQLAAAGPVSIVRRNPWISGAKVNEEPHPQVLGRTHPFTGLISVSRDDGECCVFTLLLNLALIKLTVVINKCALNVCSYSSTLESSHYLRVWRVFTLVCCTGDFENEQVLLEYRGGFGFCSYLGYPAMYCSTLP